MGVGICTFIDCSCRIAAPALDCIKVISLYKQLNIMSQIVTNAVSTSTYHQKLAETVSATKALPPSKY